MTIRSLAPLDSAFVMLEVAGAPLHIGVVAELEVPDDGLDGRSRFEAFRRVVAERIHEIPVLTQRVIRTPFDLAWPVLVDDPDFDIDEHVVSRSVPAPGGAAELEAVVARVMARELATDRPLWEMSYLEGLASNRAALVFKVHHAIADGVSAASTFANLFDLSPEVRPPAPRLPAVVIPPVPSPFELLSRTTGELLRRPLALVDVAAAGLARTADLVERLTDDLTGKTPEGADMPSVLEAPRTSINGTPSYAKKFTRLRVDLADVKTAAKSRGGSVTDFVMATVSGGLRRLFEERGESYDKDLVAFVPVNVRREGTEGQLGNQISAMLVHLAANEPDPEARFRHIAGASKVTAVEQRTHSAELLSTLANTVGPAAMALAGRTIANLNLFDQLPPVGNVTVSSVPGPPFPLYVSGHRLLTAAPLGPLMGGIALNITVLSYVDGLEYGLLACAKWLPELDELRGYLEDEVAYFIKTPAPGGLEPA
jgi:diacylglycerol O-acyltransferase / wax synthase